MTRTNSKFKYSLAMLKNPSEPVKAESFEWNLSKADQGLIVARTNFKYEDSYTMLWQAIDAAMVRSTKSVATIYLFRESNGYMVNAHGVLKQHQTLIARFKKGVEI